MANFFSTITSGVGELADAFTTRRDELMRGEVGDLWEVVREDKRVFLRNVSRDIDVQEAWFIEDGGDRQALGRVRPGDRTEVRAYRHRPADDISGTLNWRVRSMIFPGRSIERSEVLIDHAEVS